MHLSESQLADYERDGYLILDGLLTRDECRRYQQEIDGILAEVRDEALAAGKADDEVLATGVYVGLALRRQAFRDLAADPRMVDPLEDIWGPDIGFLSDKVVFKSRQVEFASPWHQDWSYWKGTHKISIWIPLEDATEQNGCLMLIPGSHKEIYDHDKMVDAETRGGFGNRLDLAKLGLDREPVVAPIPAGSGILFHDLTLHASLPNKTGAERPALIITYRNLAEEDLDYPSLAASFRVRVAASGTAV